MKVFFVMGPTASGKSAFALEAAANSLQEGVPAAIVNCDSIQIYQGLEIGSAQPTAHEKAKVPHYLYSYVAKGARRTTGDYVKDFYLLMKDLEKKFFEVYVVGGSGFYFQAIEKGMYNTGPSNPEIRAQVEAELKEPEGPQKLHLELQRLDPQTAAKISVNDHYRLGRALELIRVHGRSVTEIRQEMEATRVPFAWPLEKWGLNPSKELLQQNVKRRTEEMISRGLLEEVGRLLSEGLGFWPALQSVGYKECLMYLNGEIGSRDELYDLINRNTLNLCKRQKTWFQRDPQIQWKEVVRKSGGTLSDHG